MRRKDANELLRDFDVIDYAGTYAPLRRALRHDGPAEGRIMLIDALDCKHAGSLDPIDGFERKHYEVERGRAGLPRLIVVSNRVGVPDGNARAGGMHHRVR